MSTVSAIGRESAAIWEQRGLTLAGLSERSEIWRNRPCRGWKTAMATPRSGPWCGQRPGVTLRPAGQQTGDGGELLDKGVIGGLIEKSTDDPRIEDIEMNTAELLQTALRKG